MEGLNKADHRGPLQMMIEHIVTKYFSYMDFSEHEGIDRDTLLSEYRGEEKPFRDALASEFNKYELTYTKRSI